MNVVDIIVMLVLVAILSLIFYFTRTKKKKGGSCTGCHSDCSSCHGFSNFYEDYKKDGMDTK